MVFWSRLLVFYNQPQPTMPAVTLDESNVTEGSGKLREKSDDDNSQIEEKKEKEIKEQATQLNETGGKFNSFTLINEIFHHSLNI